MKSKILPRFCYLTLKYPHMYVCVYVCVYSVCVYTIVHILKYDDS